MRAIVIVLIVTVFLEQCSSRGSVNKNDTRNVRQLVSGPSPLNPFYSPFYNKTHISVSAPSPQTFLPRYDVPQTHHLSPHESITVIPNTQPHYTPQSYQQYQPVQPQQYQQYQSVQQQYQQPHQQIYYTQPSALSVSNFYSTPAPIYSTPLYDIPVQQYPQLIDQGYFKYPVYIDPILANTFKASSQPMYMKKRTIHDLCAQYAPEEKTVIYVLSQNPREPPEEIEVPKVPPPTRPSKPEVFFVKYNTPEEADIAQKHIQAQYDSLGGTSETSNEGISPVSSVHELLHGSNNVTRAIQFAKIH